ncbi:MAG: MBOAT family protein, partial [Magnetospirillum sp.]
LADRRRQFWRRWHISLSRWLRDYLYKPLGGSRHGMARMVLATMLTMALGGLWHGANWTFVIWGLIHGGLVALEHLAGWAGWSPDRLPPWLGRLLTLHLVAVAWVLFRAPDLGAAGHIFAGFLRPGGWDALVPALWPCLLTALVFILHRWDSVPAVKLLARRLPPSVTIPVCAAAVATAALLAMDNPNAFIYFDF